MNEDGRFKSSRVVNILCALTYEVRVKENDDSFEIFTVKLAQKLS